MYRQLKYIIKNIIIIFIIIISFLPYASVNAVTDDDGPPVNDSSIVWHTTCYGGENLGAQNPATRTSIYRK